VVVRKGAHVVEVPASPDWPEGMNANHSYSLDGRIQRKSSLIIYHKTIETWISVIY
jgi:hypothetical protein